MTENNLRDDAYARTEKTYRQQCAGSSADLTLPRIRTFPFRDGLEVPAMVAGARRILRWEDRDVVRRLIPRFFPEGFDEFGVPEHISFENILEDDFVPYMWTFRHEPLRRFMGEERFEVLAPRSGRSMRHPIDKETLKARFTSMKLQSVRMRTGRVLREVVS